MKGIVTIGHFSTAILVVLSMLSLSLLPEGQARADLNASISISPTCQAVTVGNVFDVEVHVYVDPNSEPPANQSRGAQVGLSWPSNIECLSVEEGTFYSSYGSTMAFGLEMSNIDPTAGTITPISVILLGGSGGPSGEGTLLKLTFKALANGTAEFTFNEPEPPDPEECYVTDSTGANPVTPLDLNTGEVRVGGACEMADLLITEQSSAWVTEGQTYTVSYKIKNQGTQAAGPFQVGLYIDNLLIATDNITSLAVNATRSSQFSGNINLSGNSDTVKICADEGQQIVESNESNNCYIETWPPASLVPLAPSQLMLKGFTDVEVQLTWKDNSTNELGFRLERGLDEEFTEEVHDFMILKDVTLYKDETAFPDKEYYYRVYAYNSHGESAASNTLRVRTMTGEPTAPIKLEALKITAEKVQLKWLDKSDNESGFVVERASDTAFEEYTRKFNVSANGDSIAEFTDATIANTLKYYSTYYYRVYAFNKYGESSTSNKIKVTIPQAPVELTATVVGSNQVNLKWEDKTRGESGFRIERALNTVFTAEKTSFYVGADVTNYGDLDVKDATTYYYRVFAYNEFTDSPQSEIAVVSTPTFKADGPSPKLDLAEKIDVNGIVKKQIDTSSLKGIQNLRITYGTEALTADDKPLQYIEIDEIEDIQFMSLIASGRSIISQSSRIIPQENDLIPPISITLEHESRMLGHPISLQPGGATLNPPMKVTLTYDLSELPPGVKSQDIVLAYYDVQAQRWVELDSKVNPSTQMITAGLSYLGLVAVVAKGSPIVDWWRVSAILVIEMIIGWLIIVVLQVRRAKFG